VDKYGQQIKTGGGVSVMTILIQNGSE